MNFNEYIPSGDLTASRRRAADEAARGRRNDIKGIRLGRALAIDGRDPQVIGLANGRDAGRFISAVDKFPTKKPVISESLHIEMSTGLVSVEAGLEEDDAEGHLMEEGQEVILAAYTDGPKGETLEERWGLPPAELPLIDAISLDELQREEEPGFRDGGKTYPTFGAATKSDQSS